MIALLLILATPQPVFVPPAPIVECFMQQTPPEWICVTKKGGIIHRT